MGNIRWQLKWFLKYVWKRSSETFKGAAVKLCRPTCLPSSGFFCNMGVKGVDVFVNLVPIERVFGSLKIG